MVLIHCLTINQAKKHEDIQYPVNNRMRNSHDQAATRVEKIR